jgi:hypothetical protein
MISSRKMKRTPGAAIMSPITNTDRIRILFHPIIHEAESVSWESDPRNLSDAKERKLVSMIKRVSV